MPRRAHFEDAFFEVLQAKGDVALAADLSGVRRSTVYYRRKDPAFRERWENALAAHRQRKVSSARRALRRADLSDF